MRSKATHERINQGLIINCDVLGRDCDDSIIDDLHTGSHNVRASQTAGMTYLFKGKMIAYAYRDSPNGTDWTDTYQVWLTPGGNYIAYHNREKETGPDIAKACVIYATGTENDHAEAVMNAFGWTHVARDMVKKQLGWKLHVEIL